MGYLAMALAYAWAWGPLVLTGLMVVGAGAHTFVTDERDRREAQGLEPMRWWLMIGLAIAGAVLAAIGFVVFMA